MSNIVTILDTSPIAQWMRATGWIWPALEIAHLYGMIILFGSLIFFDLQVLLYGSHETLMSLRPLMGFAIIGFVANVITGGLLVLGDLDIFLNNPALWAKLGLILAAGINACLFHALCSHNAGGSLLTQSLARFSAALSLLLWAMVIILARFISYTQSM